MLNRRTKSLIRDETELPYPKDVIRAVIKGALACTQDEDVRDRLKVAYLRTADFQRLTPEERQAISIISEVDNPAPRGSELFRQQIENVAKYGPLHSQVAKRMIAECEARYIEAKSL